MLRGSCLCGAVRYSAAGPVESASHCYCTMCQKQHGAGAGTYANVARAGLKIEQGDAFITEYASSSHGRRAFCRQCGSTLFWRSEESPERIAVTLGTLDEPYTGPVERELYLDTKPSWLPVKNPD
ncbi:GFA family protein [Massilia sp. IC2-476]|uniref:GFA family protein n=1 Tax=Massilia sp. IC2-476 TaxID=2887199 RepID=UPI001D101D64|nr:GFA family protein [Massilia sp. IC2-476]MCC2971877.1 GFA family protein [Massilia sp. IC2-476]